MIDTIDEFLSQEDLEICVEYVKTHTGNRVVKNIEFADYIWNKYSNKLLSIDSTWEGLHQDITLTNSIKPISKHQDRKRNNETKKLLIYLNNLSGGGTIFYLPSQTLLVENKQNRLVCFDINLPHEGQIFEDGRKLAIGFRPRISENKL